jgi:tetratricopeptide (TPR) repeat protein
MKDQNKKAPVSVRRSTALSPARKRAFTISLVALPIVLMILCELGLRMMHYGGNTALFVSIPDENSKYYGINLDVAKRYFTTLSDVPTPRKDLFLKVKPENGYRIFVLGESTAAGFPFGNNITFSRILNRRLSDLFPEKHVEIVNTALTAINTYTQLDFMDEILQCKPDAILIYSGHNEFYGALGVGSMESLGKHRWIVKAVLALEKFKTYMLVQDLIGGIERTIGLDRQKMAASDPSATLMERIVEHKIIPLHSDEYDRGADQFRENLREIIQKAQRAGVKVILSELVSNVRDNAPFESIEGSERPSARAVYDEAKALEAHGRYDEAKTKYYAAKDLDALRFRAPEDFNGIIHDVASEFSVPVVPMKARFESSSPHMLIGNNLMFEHLHPNLDGYFLMADAFFETMQDQKLIAPDWKERHARPSASYREHWGYTVLDSVYAARIVARLKGGWPFKNEHEPNHVLEGLPLSTIEDSIAAKIVPAGVLTLEQGHIELAGYYENRGDLGHAFNEYNALMSTVPYFDLFYEPAVKMLVGMKQYDKALEVLFELKHYQESSFTYKWIGQINLMSGRIPEGIAYLEKAREGDPANAIILYNLGYAYFSTMQDDKGNAIEDLLRQSSADQSLVAGLETVKTSRSTGRQSVHR